MKLFCFTLVLLLCTSSLFARGKKHDTNEYIASAFSGVMPEAQLYELNEQDKEVIKKILSHKLKQTRFRYWKNGNRFVWILNEIGKYKPITAGYTIDNGAIKNMKVLVFRESRGWEVQKSFYSKRFTDAQLVENQKLDKRIDNISGATMSVRATKKMARIALYLSRQVTDNAPHEEALITP